MSDHALNKKFKKEINGGITGLVLLNVLAQSESPMYGYQIAKMLDNEQAEEPLFKQGALYPVLRSMEKNELLVSSIQASDSGPPRKYYEITNSGQDMLVQWTAIWQETKDFVDHILEGLKQ